MTGVSLHLRRNFKEVRGKYLDVNIVNVFTDVKWHAPKLKFGHILSVPLCDGDNPECIYLIKEVNKIPEVLDISELI